MSNKKIFISGSIKIASLFARVYTVLNEISINNTILIGDAPGIDSLVQEYFFNKKHKDIIVYHVTNKPRNNIGNFKTRKISIENNIPFFVNKDRQMAKDCDLAIMIWDGKSKGTLSNIEYVKELNKPYLIIEENKMAMMPGVPFNPLRQPFLQRRGKGLNKDNPRDLPYYYLRVMGKRGCAIQLTYNDGKHNGKYQIDTDPLAIYEILEMTEYVANTTEPCTFTKEFKSKFDMQRRQLEKMTVIAKFIIGRDSNGEVFHNIALMNMPVASFPFTTDNFYDNTLGNDGEKINKQLGSTLRAKAWVNMYKGLMSGFISGQKEPAYKVNPQQGGGYGGGYNQQPQQQSFQSPPNTEWSTDVDF